MRSWRETFHNGLHAEGPLVSGAGAARKPDRSVVFGIAAAAGAAIMGGRDAQA